MWERGPLCSSSPDSQRGLGPFTPPLYVAFSSGQKGWLLCLLCQSSQAPTCNIIPNTWLAITEEFAFCLNLAGCCPLAFILPSPPVPLQNPPASIASIASTASIAQCCLPPLWDPQEQSLVPWLSWLW